jgi:hypothetical protein
VFFGTKSCVSQFELVDYKYSSTRAFIFFGEIAVGLDDCQAQLKQRFLTRINFPINHKRQSTLDYVNGSVLAPRDWQSKFHRLNPITKLTSAVLAKCC